MDMILKSMIGQLKSAERYLFVYATKVHGLNLTFVRCAPADTPQPDTLDDLDVRIDAAAVRCRLREPSSRTSTSASAPWQRTCTFRPWPVERNLLFMPRTSHGMYTCVEELQKRQALAAQQHRSHETHAHANSAT